MERLDEQAIARIARGMIGCTLPKAEWTHQAHFAAALWLLRQGGPVPAEQAMPGLIRAYNASVGGVNDDHNGYHHTITLASIGAARAALAEAGAAPLSTVLAGLMASPCGRSGWLDAYWSEPVLMSVRAQRGWVAPDRAPLPFAAGEG